MCEGCYPRKTETLSSGTSASNSSITKQTGDEPVLKKHRSLGFHLPHVDALASSGFVQDLLWWTVRMNHLSGIWDIY
jgi:hypothetical protein